MGETLRHRTAAVRLLVGSGVQPVTPVGSSAVFRAAGFGIRAGGRSTGKNFGSTADALDQVRDLTGARAGALIRFVEAEPENGLFICRLEDIARLMVQAQETARR